MSQAALARAVGMDQSTINGLVNGHQRSSTKLPAIARALKTTSAYLEGETDDHRSEAPDDFLDAQDREALELIRELAPRDRAAILQIARSLVSRVRDAAETLHSPRLEFKGQGAR